MRWMDREANAFIYRVFTGRYCRGGTPWPSLHGSEPLSHESQPLARRRLTAKTLNPTRGAATECRPYKEVLGLEFL
jgi:hypothetical protein